MIHKVFSVYDVKSEVYGRPFCAVAVGEALRAFKDLASDKNTTVGRYPDDFKLCQVGEFNDLTAEYKNHGPVTLGFASEFVGVAGVPVGVKKEVSRDGVS